jgi:hypothetical protein
LAHVCRFGLRCGQWLERRHLAHAYAETGVPGVRSVLRRRLVADTRALLLIGFAFAVMADPGSSGAYTIGASVRALHGHISLLLATQVIVLGIIALVDVNYWQLVGRFPLGGGLAEAAAQLYGKRAKRSLFACLLEWSVPGSNR